ncbi:hypothetical protein SANTM175S_00672 [Streptomyces antimycoticus]
MPCCRSTGRARGHRAPRRRSCTTGLSATTLSGMGRLDPSPSPPTTTRSTSTPMSWSSAPDRPGSRPPPLPRAPARRVILLDDQPTRRLACFFRAHRRVGGQTALEWVTGVRAALDAAPEVVVLRRTTAFGRLEQPYWPWSSTPTTSAPTLPSRTAGVSRQRLWHIRARQVVLATGIHERPLVFAGNDRPGVIAGSVRSSSNGMRWCRVGPSHRLRGSAHGSLARTRRMARVRPGRRGRRDHRGRRVAGRGAGTKPARSSNMSANRTTLELSGPAARQVLKGRPLDLHPRAFGPGHAVSTRWGPSRCCSGRSTAPRPTGCSPGPRSPTTWRAGSSTR